MEPWDASGASDSMRFSCHIENGKLRVDTPDKYQKYLSGLNEGVKLTLDIDKKTNVRSRSQNNYYWMYLGVIEDETGNEANDLHELFKRKFLPPQFKTILGHDLKLPASTTTLSKHDFSEYMEKICAETGVPIPDPELAGYIPSNQQLLEPDTVKYPTDYSAPLL